MHLSETLSINDSMLIQSPTFIRQVNQKPLARCNVKRFTGRGGLREMRGEVERMTVHWNMQTCKLRPHFYPYMPQADCSIQHVPCLQGTIFYIQ
jgi:hypothetical protein